MAIIGNIPYFQTNPNHLNPESREHQPVIAAFIWLPVSPTSFMRSTVFMGLDRAPTGFVASTGHRCKNQLLDMRRSCHWIGLRENLQETMFLLVFTMNYVRKLTSRNIFSSSDSIMGFSLDYQTPLGLDTSQ